MVLTQSCLRGLQERGEADVLGDRFPIERELEVAKAAVRVDPLHVRALRQHHRARHLNADLLRERVAEELVVDVHPERVVDDVRALQRRLLQVHLVVRHLVRDAVEDDAVRARLAHAGAESDCRPALWLARSARAP